MKALITGFSAFGGEAINPTLLVLEKLENEIAGIEILKSEIPTVFGKSLTVMEGLVAEHQPDFIIALGQAGGRFAVTPEVVAINLDEARIADNEGNQPSGVKIKAEGENAYFSTLPYKAMVKALREQQIPAELSYSAGTFVCNHLFYGLMYYLKNNYPNIRAGFVHLPFIREQVMDKGNQPFMELSSLVRAVEIMIKLVAENPVDIAMISGREH